MMIYSAFITYLMNSSVVTWIVLIWLSAYFIISFTILFSRYAGLGIWKARESRALNNILNGIGVDKTSSIFKQCKAPFSKDKLDAYINFAESKATSGLTLLSIIASTSPFIGLFGTIISILETFSKLGTEGGGINAIASSISEALVVTACGIFVAIPAYTFHLMIRRKAYEILILIKREASFLLSKC